MLTLIFALACAPGTIVLTQGGGDTGALGGSDDTGASEPDPNPHAGDYEGDIVWYMEDWEWWICEGEDVDFTVDDEGSFAASGTCVYYGQYDDYDMEFELVGTVDEEGDVEGEISWETWAIYDDWTLDTLTSDLWGSVEDGDFEVSFEADSFMGDYGDYPVNGELSAELE